MSDEGVRRGSEFHRTEYFGPILGIMTADSLDEAIDIVNEVDYGLTSGLHSLDPAEIGTWLSRIQAGNLYVNRGITGAIVRRQPFGGWKKSAVGAGTKAGGPNYLLGLGSWTPAPAVAASGVAVSGPVSAFVRAAEVASPVLDRALASDEQAWSTLFGTANDVSALSAERNIARYLPFPSVQVRLAAGAGSDTDPDASVVELVRVVAAALRAGTTIEVSTAATLPSSVAAAIRSLPIVRSLSQTVSDEAFASSVASGPSTRVRLIGGDTSALYSAVGGRPDVAVYGEPRDRGRAARDPAVRPRAGGVDHGAPLRHAEPPDRRPDLTPDCGAGVRVQRRLHNRSAPEPRDRVVRGRFGSAACGTSCTWLSGRRTASGASEGPSVASGARRNHGAQP